MATGVWSGFGVSCADLAVGFVGAARRARDMGGEPFEEDTHASQHEGLVADAGGVDTVGRYDDDGRGNSHLVGIRNEPAVVVRIRDAWSAQNACPSGNGPWKAIRRQCLTRKRGATGRQGSGSRPVGEPMRLNEPRALSLVAADEGA